MSTSSPHSARLTQHHELIVRLERAFGASGPAIVAAYLFGSVARNESGPMSDVDVAVLFDQHTVAAGDRLTAAARLEHVLGRESVHPVQVVVLNDASPSLVHRALRDGVLLAGAGDPRRVAFEARAMAEYLDFQPLLERLDLAIIARSREGRLGA